MKEQTKLKRSLNKNKSRKGGTRKLSTGTKELQNGVDEISVSDASGLVEIPENLESEGYTIRNGTGIYEGEETNKVKDIRNTTEVTEINSVVKTLRECRDQMLCYKLLDAASFYADKVASLSNDLKDLCILLEIYNDQNLNARAQEILKARNVMGKIHSETNVHLTYQLALCVFNLHMWEDSITILKYGLERLNDRISNEISDKENIELKASLLYTIALAHCNNNNITNAKTYLIKAINTYPKNIAAFLWVVNNKIMTTNEEKQLVSNIDFKGTCGEDWKFIRSLYHSKLYSHDNSAEIEESMEHLHSVGLETNHDIMLPLAEKLYLILDYKSCMKITKAIMDMDFFNFRAIITHVACLYELRLYNDIYYIANKLIRHFPYSSVTWYVVGVYYFTVKKNLAARGYFKRALKLNFSAAEAWIAFGHTFVEEGQIEQSLTAYSTSIRLVPGVHQPALHMGSQHMCLSNTNIAAEYFKVAYKIRPSDPILLNEMGVLYYKECNYEKAAEKFGTAIRLSSSLETNQEMLKIIYSNLANTYRRMKCYLEAVESYEKTLELDPCSVEAIMGLAFIHEIFGDIISSMLNYDKILSFRPDFFKARDLLLCNIDELSIYAKDRKIWPLKDYLNQNDSHLSLSPDNKKESKVTAGSKMSIEDNYMCT